jgi:hypothetical protein
MYLEHGEKEGVGGSALRHLGQLDLVGGEAPGGQVRQPALHRLQAAVGLHQAARTLLAVDLNTRQEYLKIRRKSRCSVENYKKRMSSTGKTRGQCSKSGSVSFWASLVRICWS